MYKHYLVSALAMGIDYELFWKLNPRKMEPFAEAFKMKNELKQKQDNVNAWLEGMYNAYAIAACLSKNAKYPNEPIGLNEASISEEEKLSAETQMFEAYAIAFNQEFLRRQGYVIVPPEEL